MSGSNTWVHEDSARLKDGVIVLPTIYWDQTNFTENPSRSADFFEGA